MFFWTLVSARDFLGAAGFGMSFVTFLAGGFLGDLLVAFLDDSEGSEVLLEGG